MRLLTLLICFELGAAELIDRIAVSVGSAVITESELLEQMRVRAFLEEVPLRLDAESKRDAADRLIQQALIRREIETTRYVIPEASQAEALLVAFKRTRFRGDETLYGEALRQAGLTPADVAASFQWQLTVLRFIEFRFRPGIQISPEDLRDYYQSRFLPSWKPGTPAPPLEEASGAIEEVLVQERIDNQLDRWISLTRTQVSIRYREEVFAGS